MAVFSATGLPNRVVSCRNIDAESFLSLAQYNWSLQAAKGVDCERLLFFFKDSETFSPQSLYGFWRSCCGSRSRCFKSLLRPSCRCSRSDQKRKQKSFDLASSLIVDFKRLQPSPSLVSIAARRENAYAFGLSAIECHSVKSPIEIESRLQGMGCNDFNVIHQLNWVSGELVHNLWRSF